MKALILVTLLIVAAQGCKKSTAGDPGNAGAPGCPVTVITPSSGNPVNIYYDNEGRIETIKTGLSVIDIIYRGDSIIATQRTSGTFYQRRKYKMNSNGFPAAVRVEHNESGSSWTLLSYEYEGKELRKQTATTYISNLSIVTHYYWSNGNLDSMSDGSNVHKYEYDTGKTFRTGDASSVTTLLSNDGVALIRTKNMRKTDRYTSPGGDYTLNYAYVFDDAGKVTAVTENSLTYALQYQCP